MLLSKWDYCYVEMAGLFYNPVLGHESTTPDGASLCPGHRNDARNLSVIKNITFKINSRKDKYNKLFNQRYHIFPVVLRIASTML